MGDSEHVWQTEMTKLANVSNAGVRERAEAKDSWSFYLFGGVG